MEGEEVIKGGDTEQVGTIARADIVVGSKVPPEGGREWPHWMGWAPKVGGNDQGGNKALFVNEPSEMV
jgi:hypothetical protein